MKTYTSNLGIIFAPDAVRTMVLSSVKQLKRVTAAIAILTSVPLALSAQEMQFFSIGTGGTGATYYPLGGAVANAISNPPGSRACDDGGSCGVEGLIAMAQSSKGSVDNIEGIGSGRFSSGFSQSDIAYWAYSGIRGHSCSPGEVIYSAGTAA